MTGDELRQKYLDFFKTKDHLILPSAPLVPQDDPSLLWINAGMAPFKPYFDGRKEPPENRIATSQKCIRTNDIDNVGRTDRHQTFFEMLGNFSFGDYFKEEAIVWGWEFVTEELGLDPDKLWITIYKDDEEAHDIWKDIVGLEEERIIRMGKKENYWQIGTGPCGPCSEIHYDRGPEYGTSEEDVIGGEGDRYLEIWNLVFTQYNYTEDGEYLELPNKNIDTGMGLERVASILQGVESNFETDLLYPMIEYLEADSGVPYKKNEETKMAYRLIADHIRGVTMAIFDGVLPSNEGRGYVIRRLLRRAVRYGGKLGYEEPFLFKMVPVVIDTMSGGYPNLEEKEEQIIKFVKAEEERFLNTLEQGLGILSEMIDEMEEEGKTELSGQKAFRLYDTFGFPLDLTKDVLKENDLIVDEDGFEAEMAKQKQRAREAREEVGFGSSKEDELLKEISGEIDKTEFVGYKHMSNQAQILKIIKDGELVEKLKEGEEGEIILDKSSFYAESGGQIGDKGTIASSDSKAVVKDTVSKLDFFLHFSEVQSGSLEVGDRVTLEIYEDNRRATMRNHSATHLLHQSLRDVLGDHVNQSGSLVEPERFRFDFTHFSALTPEELEEIEYRVNEQIINNLDVKIEEMDIDKAKEKGAAALFTEKYGQKVRVVQMGDFSIELCGGTHVNRTGDIGLFKIVNEGSIASGIRRIEAVTGFKALEYVNEREELLTKSAELLNAEAKEVPNKVNKLQDNIKELEKEIRSLKDKIAHSKTTDVMDEVEEINGVKVLTHKMQDVDNNALRKMADKLQNKMESGIIVLASALDNKVLFVAKITQDLVDQGYNAGDIIGQVAQVAGGGGGGRPDMAQAGGSKVDKIDEALAKAKEIIKEK
ncbi:MAG TPA: alanine--tRNA ligase [Halanaerobiales bacterium]|nr:alanine--tRNA ligase [Halanaerobiales bacterium]